MRAGRLSGVSPSSRHIALSKIIFAGRGMLPCLAVALWVLSFGPAPAAAESLDLVTEHAVGDIVLSDGLPDNAGQWRTRVQHIFNAMTKRIERRRYEYFDPDPSRHLDVVWYPQHDRTDRPGKISGVGRMVWRRQDGSAWDPAAVVGVFKGEMRAGKADGSGEYVTSDGLVYDGQWKDGRANGSGHLKLPNGQEYSGWFRDGRADGKGREFEITGEVFEGSFRAGLRHGAGNTRLPSGFTYESSWTRGTENPGSRRIRLAQIGNAGNLGGGADIRMEVTVLQRPALPEGVQIDDVVAYGSSNDGSQITVRPADGQLMDVWKGNGQLQTPIGGSTIRNGFFGIDRRYIDAVPPTFLLGFENRSSQPITIASLRLEVSESSTDNEPAIQLAYPTGIACMGSFTVDYNLENFGESPAIGAQMRMRFSAPGGPAAPQFVKPVGNLAGRQHIDLEQELAQFGVDVAQLKQIQNDGILCPSGSLPACLSSTRSNPLFGTLGRQLDLDGLQIIVPASGFLEYHWVDSKGGSHSRSSPFQVKVGLGKFKQEAECGEGSAPAITTVNAVQLKLDATNYALNLTFQHTIAAGQVARFSLPLAAAKSSVHSFRIVATLSDNRVVSSLPISLLYFRPRMLPNN
jgi:hypothetical protein